MKKNMITCAFCMGLLLVSVKVLHAEWEQTGGPYGGDVGWMEISEGVVLAGIPNGGIYRSLYSGTSWMQANTGFTDREISLFNVRAFAVLGSTVFAGMSGDATGSGGAFRSTDNGETWEKISSGLPLSGVRSLAVHDTTVFAGTDDGIYLSVDKGTTWIVTDSRCTHVRAFAVSGDNIYAAGSNGVFLSTGNGTGWTEVTAGLTSSDVYSLAENDGTVFAGTRGGGVFRSTDNGASWSAVNNGITDLYLFALKAIEGTIFAGTAGGVFVSTDNGTTWTALNTGLTNTNIRVFAVSQRYIFAGTEGGMFLLADNRLTWNAVNKGIVHSCVNLLTASGGSVFAATRSGLFQSVDNGTTWKVISKDIRIPPGVPSSTFQSCTVSDGTIFTGTRNSGLFRSTDNGTSWEAITTGLPDSCIFSCTARGGDLFAGTRYGGVFHSIDNGTSWNAVNAGLPDCMIKTLAANGGTVFAGTNAGVFRSTDNGATWTRAGSALDNCDVVAFDVNGDTIVAATDHYTVIYRDSAGTQHEISGECGVYRSTDDGISWKKLGLSPRYFRVVSLAVNSGRIFVGTDKGIALIGENGSGCTEVGSGLPDSTYVSLTVDGGYLYAGTVRYGVWRRPLSDLITVAAIEPQPAAFQPLSFRLHPPGRSDTRLAVEFALPHAERVTVKMYTITGKEVASLVNKRLDAGSYRYLWDTHASARGCYAVRFQAGATGFVRTIQTVY